ncbi:MAG: helix-hairpin-helix domain-containing protein [Caldilineaceae bacterium]
MNRIRWNTRWLLAAILITVGTLGILFAPSARAAEQPRLVDGSLSPISFSPDQRVFNEDLLVADGQVIDDNVAVLNGNVTIRAGGVINGDLSVVRGDVEVAGQIRGDLAVVQGDAKLRASARVEGDVSIVGGEVERAEGAFVGGNFVGGPSRDWQDLFNENNGTDTSSAPQFRNQRDGRSWLVLFLWRLVRAVLWTLLITGLVVLIAWLAPAQVKKIARTAEAEPVLSFAVGLVVSLVATFLSMGLFATLCLAPVGVLLSSLLAIAGLLGWAATAVWIGEKLAGLSSDAAVARIPSLVFVAGSTLILTGLIFFGWALLACVGFIAGLLVVSPGVGAVLVNLARHTRTAGSVPEREPGGELVSAPFTAKTEEKTGAEADQPEETNAKGNPSVFASGDDLGLSAAERTALGRGAGIPEGQPDDFTRLKGIGPAFDRRLKEAGITTFAALAAATPEEISAVIGWPPERVVRDELREQAAALAAGE